MTDPLPEVGSGGFVSLPEIGDDVVIRFDRDEKNFGWNGKLIELRVDHGMVVACVQLLPDPLPDLPPPRLYQEVRFHEARLRSPLPSEIIQARVVRVTANQLRLQIDPKDLIPDSDVDPEQTGAEPDNPSMGA